MLLSEHLMEKIVTHLHQGTHYGKDGSYYRLQKFIIGSQMQRTIQKVVQNCLICARNNPKTGPLLIIKGIKTCGTEPGDDFQIDFNVMPQVMGNYKYLLVFVDTFT